MNCKSCNTRIPGGTTVCPNCGLVSSSNHSSRAEAPRSSLPLSPSNAQDEIDLDEIATPVEAPKVARPRPSSPAPSDSSSAVRSEAHFASAPRPSELRSMLADQLDALEPGLEVFSRKGRPSGANFDTDVGSIDLLASDESGGLVVIMIADASAKEIVTDMLARIGWVRKHLSEKGQEVRGFVISESVPEGAEYAAAAVADTISFKTYRMQLTFSDLEI